MKLFLIFLSLSMFSFAKEKTIGLYYYKNILGNLHQNPVQYSSSLTTLACGHPVKLIDVKNLKPGWLYGKVGAYKGYIKEDFLVKKKPHCFQFRFPKYFEAFNLDLSELYYWGRLYDQFIQGESKVNN